MVDAQGALHLETTNCFYGRKVRTSSPAGVVPAGRWVHVAGVSAGHPISFRRLFVDGREVQARPLAWGDGLIVVVGAASSVGHKAGLARIIPHARR